jgi:hypothetical protein
MTRRFEVAKSDDFVTLLLMSKFEMISMFEAEVEDHCNMG